MTIAIVCARRRGRQLPKESSAVSPVPGFFGVASVVRNLRCRFRHHVGRPFWLRLFLASFLACRPPSFLPSWVLSVLGSVRKGFSFFSYLVSFWIGSCGFAVASPVKQAKMLPVFVFVFLLGFALS